MVLASTRQLRSQDPVFLHAHCTDGLTGFEGREGENEVGGGIGIGGGSESRAGSEMGTGSGGGRDGEMNGDGDGDAVGTRTWV